MNFTSYINWLNESIHDEIIILFPGSFKPMHMGHISLIRRYSEHPNVKEVKVLIGPGIRNGITQKEALIISKELLSSMNNVTVEAVTYPSPVLTAYKYIETAEPGIYAMAGVKKGDDYKRVEKFVSDNQPGGKYYNAKPEDVKVVELPVNVEPKLYSGRTDEYDGEPISASKLRQDVLNDDYNNFRTNYPGFEEKIIMKIWQLTQMVIKESINEKFIANSDPIRDLGIGMHEITIWLPSIKKDDISSSHILNLIEKNNIIKYKIKKSEHSGQRGEISYYSLRTQFIATKKDLLNLREDFFRNGIISEYWYEYWIDNIKIFRKNVNEKFEEDSDPIHDMGIGIIHKIKKWALRNSNDIPGNKSEEEIILLCCVDFNKYDYVANLLDYDPYLNKYHFALRYAIWNKDEKMIDLLIDRGFDLTDALTLKERKYLNAQRFTNGLKQSIKYAIKRYNEHNKGINEKFEEDSDPIHDMGIGIPLFHKKWKEIYNHINNGMSEPQFHQKYNINEKFKNIRIGHLVYFTLQTALNSDFKQIDKIFNSQCKKWKIKGEAKEYTANFLRNNCMYPIKYGLKKKKINEQFVFEGGNVFDGTSSIIKENIEPTIKAFKSQLIKLFPVVKIDFQILGSAGKKPISNDIDLGVSEDIIIDKNDNVKCEDWQIDRTEFEKEYELTRKRARTATEKQSKMQAIVKLISKKLVENGIISDPKKSVANTLFCAFAQYDYKGHNTGKTVQIDVNIGNIDWLKFSYHSETYDGNVKGLHRTQLLVALFANKKRLFKHGTGVLNSETREYESTNPQEAITLLNKLYDIKLDSSIINNFFKLHDYLIANLSIEELHRIYDIYLKILDSTRTDVPDMIQYYWIKNKERLGLQGKFLPEESNLYKFVK